MPPGVTLELGAVVLGIAALITQAIRYLIGKRDAKIEALMERHDAERDGRIDDLKDRVAALERLVADLQAVYERERRHTSALEALMRQAGLTVPERRVS